MPSRRTFVSGAAATAAALAAFCADAFGRSDYGTPRLLLGPMIGDTGPDHATIWMMAASTTPIVVEYSERPDMADARRAEVPAPAGDNDYIVTVRLTRLRPYTRYHYRILVDGERDRYRRGMPLGQFRTAPAAGSSTDFSIGFGSCARIQQDPIQPIWEAVAATRPDLFLWLGDNIYADTRDMDVLALEYQRQRGVTAFQPVGRDVPQLAVWDDHDFALNDHDRTNPVKAEALGEFRRYWANPSYGTPETPGVFFNKTHGAVDIFALDSRYHRDPNVDPDEPGKTLLGRGQMEWLKDGLRAADGVFKVLACGSGWTTAKGPGGDSWASFLHERAELLNFIRDEAIEGVILISGDTHVAEINAIPHSDEGGYDLYEFVSSPLAQRPSQSWLTRTPDIRMVTPYNMSANFGLIEFAFDGEPTATFTVRDPLGRLAWAPFTVGAAILKNGMASVRDRLGG
ncbi:MAG: alkaline phosphatase D family protein [Pseudomonadota bacterium]